MVNQDPTLLDSVLIGIKAFVPENLHSLNQNKMCKTEEDKHTKQYCESSMWMPAGQGAAAPKIIYAHTTPANEKSGPHLGCTLTLLAHKKRLLQRK